MAKTNWGGETQELTDEEIIDVIEDIYYNINRLEVEVTEEIYNEAVIMNDLGCLNKKTLDIIKFIKK